MNSAEKIKAFANEAKATDWEAHLPENTIDKLCEMVIEMAEALEKYKISEENQNRLDQVDAQTLRQIIFHGNHIANDTLTKLANELK